MRLTCENCKNTYICCRENAVERFLEEYKETTKKLIVPDIIDIEPKCKYWSMDFFANRNEKNGSVPVSD